jgi:DHA2 family multidrug resistance protein-like MFS transporter
MGTVQSAIPPIFAGAMMILAAPRSAKMVESIGSRATLLRGYAFILIAFLIMLFFWKEGTSFWVVVIAFMFVGVGIGLSGTPASRSLTGSVPSIKAGMASGTADLQRDLGGAIFTALFGAFLAAGYAASMTAAIAAAPQGTEAPPAAVSSATMSYAGAQSVAAEYPQYATQITTAAKSSFLAGDSQAYLAGIIAVLLGAVLVFFLFPKAEKERKLLGEYHQQDMGESGNVELPGAANF